MVDSLVRAFGADQPAIAADEPAARHFGCSTRRRSARTGSPWRPSSPIRKCEDAAPERSRGHQLGRSGCRRRPGKQRDLLGRRRVNVGRDEIELGLRHARPAPGAPGAAALFTEGAGSSNGDPLFVDPRWTTIASRPAHPRSTGRRQRSLASDRPRRRRVPGCRTDLAPYATPGRSAARAPTAARERPIPPSSEACASACGASTEAAGRRSPSGWRGRERHLDLPARAPGPRQGRHPPQGRRLTISHARRGGNTLRFRGGSRTDPARGRSRVAATPPAESHGPRPSRFSDSASCAERNPVLMRPGM